MEQAIKWLEQLEELPGIGLVALSCLVLGYCLKLTPKFRNDWIPWACVTWAALAYPFIDSRESGENLRQWLVRHIMVGLIVGFTVWALHAKIIKKFEHKIPFLGSWLEDAKEPETPADKPQEPVTK